MDKNKITFVDYDDDKVVVRTNTPFITSTFMNIKTNYDGVDLTKKQTEELIVFLIDNLDKLD